MLAGNFSSLAEITIPVEIPLGYEAQWPFFLYIGSSTFPNLAQVPLARRDEFEELCLQICPAQHWLGMLVEYV